MAFYILNPHAIQAVQWRYGCRDEFLKLASDAGLSWTIHDSGTIVLRSSKDSDLAVKVHHGMWLLVREDGYAWSCEDQAFRESYTRIDPEKLPNKPQEETLF